MGNAHLKDILLRMKSSCGVDHERMKWVVLMTDPVTGEVYSFKYDYRVATSVQDALRRAMRDFNNMWSPQDV